MPVNAALVDANGFGGFFVGHAAKEFEHHDSRPLGMHAFEFLERAINKENLFISGSRSEIKIIDVKVLLITTAF